MNQVAWLAKLGRQVDAIGVSVLVALTIVVYAGLVQPVLRGRDVREAVSAQLATEHATARQLSAEAASFKRQADTLQRELDKSSVQLLRVSQTNSQLSRITNLAADAGLNVRAVVPGQPIPGNRYGAVPIQVDGNGSYAQCTAFFNRLHARLRDVGVQSFELSANPAEPDSKAEFRFQLIWYVVPSAPTSHSPPS